MKSDIPVDFQRVFQTLPSPYVVLNAEFEFVDMNEAYFGAIQRGRAELLGQNIFTALPATGESLRLLKESLERVRDQGIVDILPMFSYPIQIDGKSEERYWSTTHVPIKDESGDVIFILQKTQDVTELKCLKDAAALRHIPVDPIRNDVLERAEQAQALNQELLDETFYLRGLFMQAPSFMCVLRGREFIFEIANRACVKLLGDREVVGKSLKEAVPEVVDQEYLKLLKKVFLGKEPFVGRKMRALLRQSNGVLREFFLDFVFQPIIGVSGEVNGIFIEGSDVTDHVRAEERQAMLIRELHHRVRNTLATVQGVMNTTAKTSATIGQFQEAFAGRIASLAKTHSVMTEELKQSVSFYNLLCQELDPYADIDGKRILLQGPHIDLPSQIAVPLGLTIHELTTNAAKHGALTFEGGRLEVTWSLIEEENARALLCEWREIDGPPVLPPATKGFGSMLLNRVLSQQIRAEVDAEFDPQGFRLRLKVPLEIAS